MLDLRMAKTQESAVFTWAGLQAVERNNRCHVRHREAEDTTHNLEASAYPVAPRKGISLLIQLNRSIELQEMR